MIKNSNAYWLKQKHGIARNENKNIA